VILSSLTNENSPQDLEVQAAEAVKLYSNGIDGEEKSQTKHELYRTILSSPVLDAREKASERISQEAFVVLVAGSDTTARMLATGIYYVLADKENIMPRLQEELIQVMPDAHTRASIQELEKLPWLVSRNPVVVHHREAHQLTI
jgi:cytochrome P450